MASEDEIKLAFGLLDDNRKIIAAGKIQRWNVLKWSVAINLAFPAAIIATQAQHVDRLWLSFSIAVAVALISIGLIVHYTYRMTGARNSAAEVYQYLKESGADVTAIYKTEDPTKPVTLCYDCAELIIFSFVFLISCIPSLILAYRT